MIKAQHFGEGEKLKKKEKKRCGCNALTKQVTN